mmetsp:Transcript_7994/g.18807  ORF Transcript_7994/g.18807 Transcript_7994/m.18807 type:complete len:246 (-) Transcript_7994:165-902(-)
MTASSPARALSSSSGSNTASVGSSFNRSGALFASNTLRVLYQPPPPSLRPGTNCKSSKLGSWSRSCLQSEGANNIPRGHSCTKAMPSKRPKKRLHRSGCRQTPSASLEPGLRKPGKGLSCKCPPAEGKRTPNSGSAMSAPACVRNARVTPPPPSPSSPSSPEYFMQSLPGHKSCGAVASIGPMADLSSRSRSTLMVTLLRPKDANESALLNGSRECKRSRACAARVIAAVRERQRSSSSKSRSMW